MADPVKRRFEGCDLRRAQLHADADFPGWKLFELVFGVASVGNVVIGCCGHGDTAHPFLGD
jgi:hypothetical protein